MKQNSPSIGIVVCAREHGRMFTSLPYIQAAADHGGLPFLIPFYEDMELSYFRACLKNTTVFCSAAAPYQSPTVRSGTVPGTWNNRL